MYIDFDPLDEENSLGKHLKSIREEKEISIDDLAEATRIRKEYLIAIETDKYDDLPQGPYLNLFLKSYSEALKIDYDDIKSHLENAQSIQSKSIKTKATTFRAVRDKKEPAPPARDLKPVVDMKARAGKTVEQSTNDSGTKNYLMLIGAFVFVAFVVVILISVFSGKSDDVIPQESHSTPEQSVIVDSLPVQDTEKQVLDDFLAQYDSLTLSIHSASQQAVSIVADGIISTKLVNPTEVWSVSASDSISVSFERVDSSSVYLNGFKLTNAMIDFTAESLVTYRKTNWPAHVDTTDKE